MKLRTDFVLSVLRAVAAAFLVVWSMTSAPAQQSASQHKGVPDDWSHHHLVFSDPGSFADAVKNGAFENWARIVSDPRFRQQQMKRNAVQWEATDIRATASDVMPDGSLPQSRRKLIHRDWSMNMGSGTMVGGGQYPAKFSFSTTQATCDSGTQPDFVVYNTGLASSSTQPSVIAYDNLYSGCTGTHPLIDFQYNTIAGNTQPLSFWRWTESRWRSSSGAAPWLAWSS